MNFRDKLAGEFEDPVAEALENFKASVDAWSDAAYSRPRTAVSVGVRRGGWRLAASWALACMLASGSLAGWMVERHHQQELARTVAMKAAAQKAAQDRAAAEQSAAAMATKQQSAAKANAKNEDLLATVDSDVSREVPAAMEPLAQLVNDNGTE
jgi:alpha-D-ribose 1-methylphosphonate 5-triphosphate synthase subunit PhnH